MQHISGEFVQIDLPLDNIIYVGTTNKDMI